MTLTYKEAVDEETEVFRSENARECETCGLDFTEVVAALGDQKVYKSREVMIWLGYKFAVRSDSRSCVGSSCSKACKI